MSAKTIGYLTGIAALAAVPVLALSQGNAPAGQPRAGNELEEIIISARPSTLESAASTSSRLGLSVLETPASVHVLSGDLIRERGDFTVQDAVSRIVGVSDIGTSGNGGASVSARGFSGVNSVMRLYDGVQMFVVAGTMTFPLDSWSVDRIEVVGGPSSSLYGTGAIGGIVNVIPRKPDRSSPAHSYRLTAGSYGTYRAGVDTTGPVGERWSYRVNVSGQSADGYAQRADSSSWALSASLRFDVTDNFSLTLSEDYGRQNPATNSAIPLIDGVFDESIRRNNYNVLDADRHYKDSWTQLKAEWTPSDALMVRSNLYHLTADRRWFGAGNATYQPETGMLSRTGGSDLTHDLRQYGSSTSVVLSQELAGRENTLAVGFDFNRLTFDHVYWVSQATTLLDPYDPVPGTFQYFPGGYNYINLFHANQYSVFAENNFALTPRLSLLAGLRSDWYEVDRWEHLNEAGSDASFNPSSWRVGLLHRLRPNFTIYGNYSTATDPAGSVGNMTAAAQQMKLMSGKQVEVGAKHSFADGRGEWTAALYRIVKNDLQIAVPDEPGVTQQVGQQSSYGVELSAALLVTDAVRIEANGTVLKAQFDDFAETVGGSYVSRDGNRPTNIPLRTANLWVSWNFLPQWHVRTGVRYVGDRYADNANTQILDSYTVMDGGVRWNVSDNSMLDLRVYNATDLFYAPRGSSAAAWRPADPRTTELSWTARF